MDTSTHGSAGLKSLHEHSSCYLHWSCLSNPSVGTSGLVTQVMLHTNNNRSIHIYIKWHIDPLKLSAISVLVYSYDAELIFNMAIQMEGLFIKDSQQRCITQNSLDWSIHENIPRIRWSTHNIPKYHLSQTWKYNQSSGGQLVHLPVLSGVNRFCNSSNSLTLR